MQETCCRSRAVPLDRWFGVGVALAFSLWTTLAVAQPAVADASNDGAAQLDVVPPEPLFVDVAYPSGAEGDASVSLSFVVTTEGRVAEPEILLGDEPFASAAIAATQDWRFQPAIRGGQEVAVRIKMEVVYTQELQQDPVAEPESDGTSTETRAEPREPEARPTPEVPGTRGSAEVETVAEVVVQERRQPGSTTISRAEARQIPGALFGDPLRAVDAMPGVTTMISGLPFYYVRGAPPGNIGYYIDDIKVPLLYHALLGPSVINPELIERVTLHSAAFPGKYGRLAGGVVEAGLRTPDYDKSYRGGLGLWEADASVEAPFDDKRGNVFLGGRYAFTGLLASLATSLTLEYWNYQALVDYDITPSDQVRVFSLGAFDYFEDPSNQFFGTEFHRIDVRYLKHFGPRTSGYVGLTVGTDRSRFQEASIVDQSIAPRFRIFHQVSDELTVQGGLSVMVDAFDLELDAEAADFIDIRQLFPTRNDMVVGGFLESIYQPFSNVTVTPAVRVDLYKSDDDSQVAVDPRLSARLQVHPKVAAVHAVALSHQPPNYVPNVPGVRVAGLSGGLQETIHASSGVEAELPYDVQGRFNVFDNIFVNVTDPYSLSQDFDLDAGLARQRALGHAYGFELELRRHLTRRFGALVSYTLSRSTRSFGDVFTVSGSDRTHVLNMAGMYTLGANWRLGARSLLYSGVPGKLAGAPRFPFQRTDPFLRFDLRLERRFRLGRQSYWSLIAELLNATGSRENIRNLCTSADNCESTVIPALFLPNLKVEAQF